MTEIFHTFDDLPSPVILLAIGTRDIIWANYSAQEWLGRSMKSLQGQPIDLVLRDDDDVLYRACRTVLDNMAPVHIHDFAIRYNSEGPAQMSAVTVFKSGESLACQFSPQVESSSRSLKGIQTMNAMGRMLAHEIKNPLAGINGAAQLVRDEITTREGHALIDLIEAEIARIRRLADRMGQLGDQDTNLSDEVNIHEIVRHARRIMEPAINRRIIFVEHFDPSLPLLKGDSDALIQALLNLIKNAAEAIDKNQEGDVIMLETTYENGTTRRIGDETAAQHLPVIVRVSDNGPGIDDNMRERLFQPFTSSKPSGHGLGLALVSKVAAAHGGIIDAQNCNGWTEFSLRLPAPENI
ncbi:MAG: GHKL domain-containing protein [Hyphomonadaceae bacterium]|nr:GHKL domain-containing protein [Hyphomonadaceae bacterium]